jgi:hypothetical protein
LNQPQDIELEILKSKVASLETQVQWLNSNWVKWTSSTKDMGQKIMISLDQIANQKVN